MKPWTRSRACRGQKHCRACRTDPKFRRRLAGTWALPDGPDFDCPHGVTADTIPVHQMPLPRRWQPPRFTGWAAFFALGAVLVIRKDAGTALHDLLQELGVDMLRAWQGRPQCRCEKRQAFLDGLAPATLGVRGQLNALARFIWLSPA